MITLRCTERLRRRLGLDSDSDERRPTARLGDWYGNVLVSRPRCLAIVVNERSLLTVIVPTAPSRTFLARFQAAATRRLWDVPTSGQRVLAEEKALVPIRIGRTRDRSVVGSLNELRFLGRVHLAEHPGLDLDELGRFLCHTPMSALSTHWPWDEAAGILEGRL